MLCSALVGQTHTWAHGRYRHGCLYCMKWIPPIQTQYSEGDHLPDDWYLRGNPDS